MGFFFWNLILIFHFYDCFCEYRDIATSRVHFDGNPRSGELELFKSQREAVAVLFEI